MLIFVRNQRQWDARPLADEDVRAWRQAARGSGVRPVVAHASYLYNLASPDRGLQRRTIRGLVDELERCEALGIRHLILHPGASRQSSAEVGLRRPGAADALQVPVALRVREEHGAHV